MKSFVYIDMGKRITNQENFGFYPVDIHLTKGRIVNKASKHACWKIAQCNGKLGKEQNLREWRSFFER